MYQHPYESEQIMMHYQYPPNMHMYPIQPQQPKINYYRLLENTQKTLTTINRIIPIVTQVTPLIRNASIMFKVSKAINNMPNYDTTQSNKTTYLEDNISPTTSNPTFFS